MNEQVHDSDLHLNCADTPKSAVRVWQAGDLIADVELRRLLIRGERVAVQDIPFRLLCLLLERGGRPVGRRELHERLWPRYDWDSFERNVNTAVRKLRRAIGDDAREPSLIETLRASGYRWIGPEPVALAGLEAAPSAGVTEAAPTVAAQRPRRGWALGLAAAGAALVVALWASIASAPRSPSPPWLAIEPADTVGGPIAASPRAAALADRLRGALSASAGDGGEPVRVFLTIRDGEPRSADVSGRGAAAHLDLVGPTFAVERLLAEVAARLPQQALKTADTTLPTPAAKAFGDAGTLLVGAASIATVERALGLIETVLSAAPTHVGALRMYARAQRVLALLGRVPEAAHERRLLARDALRRAVAADPRSAAVVQDVANQLYWGEWNGAEAADWFALARRSAPNDAELLHAYAWYALADDRIGDAITAMNDALSAAPLSVSLHSDLGWFWLRTGHYDDALRQCRLALEMSATDASAQACEVRSLAELGRPDQAWAALRRHAPDWLDARSAQAFDALEGAAAYRQAMHLAAQHMRERIGAGYDTACLEAIAGQREAAEADLAAATAIGDPGLHLARVTPELVRLLGPAAVRRLAGDEGRPLASLDTGR